MRVPSKSWAAGACALALVCFALPSQATLLTNGDFETGDLTGWATQGDQTYVGVDGGFSHTGTYAAYFGPETPAGISQAVATQAGQQYRVSFWLSLQDSATPSAFTWYWDDVEQGTLEDAGAFGYTEFSTLVIGGVASSSLRFEFHNPQSFWLFDDVSVTAVPEPAALALMAIGLAGIAARRRPTSR